MNEPRQGGAKKRRRKDAKQKREEIPLCSDQLPDSSHEVWFEGRPLRESVLICYPESLREHLRECGWRLTMAFLDLGSLDPAFRGSITSGYLHAAELDLRYTARILAFAAREAVRFSETSEPEKVLGLFADDLAVRVEALANSIAARIEGERRAAHSHV